MTESTPPSGRDDDLDRVSGPEVDARLELVHASIDGELTTDEHAAVSPDEQWRTQVQSVRAQRDAVQQALSVPPVDEARRETHIATALAAFTELHGETPGATPAPADPATYPPPPGARPGDELAHRRNARAWLRRAPLGIAAAVLAAVVVVGATQLGDDGPTDTFAVGEDSSDDSGGDSAEESQTPAADEGSTASEAFDEADASGGMISYALDDEPSSLDAFVDSVAGMAGGDRDMQGRATEHAHLDLGPRCGEDEVVELAASSGDKVDLTLVQGVLGGRNVVGVINRADRDVEVTIIDLDRCAVVAVRSP